MSLSDAWDFLSHDDDVDEDVDLPTEELALHPFDPDHREVRAPQERPRPARQLFADEARDRPVRDDREHDLEYLLEVQHYAFPEEHPG